MMIKLYFLIAFMIITILLMIASMVYIIRVLKLLSPPKVKHSWWERTWAQINATVPVENEEDIDTGHEFDDIRELDNHLPPWWKGLFYATIVWGVVYLVIYHVTDNLPLSIGEYQGELDMAEENARILKASQPAEAIDETKLEYNADKEIIERGRKVFTSNNCGSCHRNDGGGNTIGPNLTDEYWLHGGSIQNVFATVNKGVVEKGMPAWGKVMSPKDVRDVAFYIMSLKGSNPPDGKKPQGELFKAQASK
ncbi:MAG TPA: cbb3-type cytochrome c oxidase N-terminal domain-containing protein [Cyclobacteriaceae bacterium]